MKKISILLAAAVTSSVAMAGQPATKVSSVDRSDMVRMQMMQKETVKFNGFNKEVLKNSAVKAATRAGYEFEGRISSPLHFFSMGITPENSGYKAAFGMWPTNAVATFSALYDDAETFSWYWNNGYIATSPFYQEFEADTQELVLEANPTDSFAELSCTVSNGDGTQTYEALATQYFAGATWQYYGFQDNDMGCTMYPTKASGEYAGTTCGSAVYDPTNNEYTSGGAWKEWIPVLSSWESEDRGEEVEVEDLTVTGFSYRIPAMSSPYMITQSWVWVNATFTQATQLEMNIYPYTEEGLSDTPIAKGIATVDAAPRGFSGCIVFDLLPVDEDGDEIDGNVVINNTEVLLSIENVNTNPAIKKLGLVYGAGTEYPKSMNNFWYRNSYIQMTYSVNGEEYATGYSDPWRWYSNEDDDCWFAAANFYWMVDASFPYVINAETGTSNFDITAPIEGGSVEVQVEPYYYMLKELIEEELMSYTVEGDWINVEIGEADANTGITIVSVECQPLSEGITGRTGAVKFTGFAQDFTINVTQGDVSGVNEIQVANDKPVYYDLQGRKLNNAPEKGIYILKEGNKVSKVIR